MLDIMNTDNLLFMIVVASVIALGVAYYFFRDIWSKDKGTPEMQAISDKIEEGAMAYLRQQYKTIGIIAVVIAVIIALLGVVAAVLGIYGDLFASVVKRQCGIKDYGTIFPGHGGILDRFDSVMFIAPFVSMVITAVFYN